jgi:hypothetical protein
MLCEAQATYTWLPQWYVASFDRAIAKYNNKVDGLLQFAPLLQPTGMKHPDVGLT